MPGDALPLLRTTVPGPRSRRLARNLATCESQNITYLADDWPIFWERAHGANVWDADGNRYIDLTGGFGVAAAGHANPRVAAAIRHQAGRLPHAMGDVHPNALKAELARALVQLTYQRWAGSATRRPRAARKAIRPGNGRVILCGSGAEAVEAALKTAVIATGRPGVIAFQGAYHGLTYGALATTWREDFRKPFAAQLGRFVTHIPYGQLPTAAQARRAGAVLVEPIQGRAGTIVPPAGFLRRLRRYCDRHGLLLIVDEIYTGFGRTGRWFACEHENVVPDVICVGKAIANGFPLSACIGSAAVMDAWPASTGEAIHTSTFLGNPLGCAAALATIRELRSRRLPARARSVGTWLARELREIGCRVRGRGLMLGIETDDAVPLAKALLQRGILVLPSGPHHEILGITPPLVVTRRQLKHFVGVVQQIHC